MVEKEGFIHYTESFIKYINYDEARVITNLWLVFPI